MGNIRIKDIATTAASTASDDFIAIDGATNGTRKLDIYNPTIGGNLTVSGVGNSSVAGTLLVATTTNSSNGKLQLATHNTIAGGIGFGTDVSLIRAGAGNLQILSGSTTGAKLTLYAPDSTSANTLSWAHPGSRFWDLGTVAGSVATLKLTVTSASSATFSIDPNVSIAATTDSSSTTTGALVVSGGLGVAKKATFGGGINGTTTNDSAAAGCVGEYVSSSIGYGGRQSLTTGTWLNVTSISLTAGDWDVSGTVIYEGTGATISRFSGAATTTSLAPDADNDTFDNRQSITTISGNVGAFPIPTRRVSISATTTIYLISRGYFSAGTLETYGRILARRVR